MLTAHWTKLATACCLLSITTACQNEQQFLSSTVDVHPEEVTECGFTPIPGTKMSRYDCNPVFSGTGEDWAPDLVSVGYHAQMVMGHPFYQIWYSAADPGTESGHSLGHAISSNGTTWQTHEANPLLEEPVKGGWDKDQMSTIKPVWDAKRQRYFLMYQGINYPKGKVKLGLLESQDGISWAPSEHSPLLDLSEPVENTAYCWPLSLGQAQDQFQGLLAGYDISSGEMRCAIYGFRTDNFAQITMGTKPLLEAGPKRYDKAGFTSAAAVEFDGTQYLFYTGFRRWSEADEYGFVSAQERKLGLATSTDGVTWTKDPNNPIPVHHEYEGYLGNVNAQRVGSRIHLWISDYYPETESSAVGYFIYEPTVEEHPVEQP
jgi:hypothetical protein